METHPGTLSSPVARIRAPRCPESGGPEPGRQSLGNFLEVLAKEGRMLMDVSGFRKIRESSRWLNWFPFEAKQIRSSTPLYHCFFGTLGRGDKAGKLGGAAIFRQAHFTSNSNLRLVLGEASVTCERRWDGHKGFFRFKTGAM